MAWGKTQRGTGVFYQEKKKSGGKMANSVDFGGFEEKVWGLFWGKGQNWHFFIKVCKLTCKKLKVRCII